MVRSMFARSASFNYDVDAVSEDTGLVCEDETRTQQQFKEEADINVLVRRFNLTGALPENVRAPTYGDFTEAYDYHTAMNAIRAAQDAFMEMPAEVRTRFENDPGKFVDFVSQESNRSEAEKLGLVLPLPPAAGVPSGAAPSSLAAPSGGEGTVVPNGGAGAS